MKKKICVLGLGYIGLPTASILAMNGFQVVGVDINCKIVDTINKGEIHIFEPGLGEIVKTAVNEGHLIAQSTPENADVFIISVPTPINHDKSADLRAVISASESIVPFLQVGNLVILESTVPPGTTKDIIISILECSGLKAITDFQVVHAPERVLPGKILKELIENDRIIGGIDQVSAIKAKEVYQSFVKGEIILTDSTTAELVKLVENTFRDVNIAFANELARICMKLSTNVWEVIELANKHPRVNILQPGPGVGGHCIAVDPWFIVERVKEDSQLIQTGRKINDSMPKYVSESILRLMEGINNPVVGVLGLTYKANVDDIRESPSISIVEQLEQAGCTVKVHDPFVYPGVSIEQVVNGSDCLALLVNHDVYKCLDTLGIAVLMRNKNIFIARNYENINNWLSAGFKVEQIGNGL